MRKWPKTPARAVAGPRFTCNSKKCGSGYHMNKSSMKRAHMNSY